MALDRSPELRLTMKVMTSMTVNSNSMNFACDIYDGFFLCCPFSHEMSWMRS